MIGKVIALEGQGQGPAELPSRILDGSLKASSFTNTKLSDWNSKPWGTSHSEYESTKARATWDPAELDYIRRYYYYNYY